MKKNFFFLVITFSFLIVQADAPGKKPMYQSDVTIQNVSKLADYDFYWQLEYDSARIFNADSTFIIPGSGGKPMDALLWAMNKKTKTTTDTIFFSNYYAPDYIIAIDTVRGNKLIYSKTTKQNNNAADAYEDSADGKGSGTNGYKKIILFSAISFAALIILVILFIKRKK